MASSGKTPIWQLIFLFVPVVIGVVTLLVLIVGVVKVALRPAAEKTPHSTSVAPNPDAGTGP